MSILSKDWIEKLVHYRQHPTNWIEDNVKIIHRARGIIPFQLYEFQKKAINIMLDKHFCCVLKSRQVGMSTVMQAYALFLALHYSNYKILILSTGIRAAIKFLDDIKGMYERLPDKDKWKMKTEDNVPGGSKGKTVNNKTEISFTNGSSITALPASSEAARGVSINLLIIDEAAFINRIESTFAAVFPTVSRAFKSQHGKPYGIIIISTPNGIQNQGKFYYDTYMNAVQKKNKFVPLKVHWTEVDEYDENWYLEQCAAVGWNYRLISAELELSFLGSGNTYIPGKILEMVQTTEPIYKAQEEDLWIFKEAEKDHKYVIGVDFAYGTGGDASAIQVIDAINLEQVAEYLSNKVLAEKLTDIVAQMSERYNGALINIERNAGGKILIDRIIEKYPNISRRMYRDSKSGDIITETPSFGKIILKKDSDFGTNVTGTSRDIILSNMYTLILERYIAQATNFDGLDETAEAIKAKFLASRNKDHSSIIHKVNGIIKSERLLFQLLGFTIDKDSKPRGKKDDAVMSYAHALYAWSKSKQYLLNNAISILSQSLPQKSPQLEFEAKYNLELLRSINSGYTAKEIDEYILELDEEDSEDIIDNSKAKAIWTAFLE